MTRSAGVIEAIGQGQEKGIGRHGEDHTHGHCQGLDQGATIGGVHSATSGGKEATPHPAGGGTIREIGRTTITIDVADLGKL